MLKGIVKKAFNLQDGEIKLALLMQGYIFLVITVLLLIKPTVNALFLSNLGVEQLPYGYLLVATVAILSTFFYRRLVQRFSIRIIAASTILLFSGFFFALAYIIDQDLINAPFLYFYYLSLSLFGVLVTSQFWIISSLVFNVREAKRLFGFIGAGAIAGGIFGGYLTSILANYFGNSIVIYAAASLLLLCLPILFTAWKMRIITLNRIIINNRNTENKEVSGSAIKLILKSKHLIYLSLIVGVSVIVAKLVDYQFSDFSHKTFTNPDELSAFFGFWFSSFNVAAFLIQLLLTNRLLSFFGVTSNLLILPMGIALGSLLFLVFPELWALVLIKGMDGSFKQSVNKAAFELSILPISFDVKKRAKPFIDVVIDSIATGIAGCLLLLVVKKLEVPSSYITIITLFFILVWIFIVYRLRDSYFKSFLKNIKAIISGAVTDISLTGASSKKLNVEILTSGKEDEILLLLQNLSDNLHDFYKPYILQLLDHPSNKVKAEAIREIYHFKHGTASDKMIEILNTVEDDEVVFEAMHYILLHTSVQRDSTIFLSYLDSEKDHLKNAALLCLADVSKSNEILARKFGLDARIEERIKEFTNFEGRHRDEERAELLLTIGLSKSEKYYFFIKKYLKGENVFLTKQAIKAACLSLNEDFIPELLALMEDEVFKDSCTEEFKNYGESISLILSEYLDQDKINDKIKILIPSIVQPFENEQTVGILIHLLQSEDVNVRLEAIKILSDFENGKPYSKIKKEKQYILIDRECDFLSRTLAAMNSIKNSFIAIAQNQKDTSTSHLEDQKNRERLTEYLTNEIDTSIETIFHLLRFKYKSFDLDVVFIGLKNKNKKSRINAIEFLDNLLDLHLKRKILPFLEYHFLNPADVEEVPFKPQSEIESLKSLVNSISPGSDKGLVHSATELLTSIEGQ
jgi:AAA family ATP:ADP antiporter